MRRATQMVVWLASLAVSIVAADRALHSGAMLAREQTVAATAIVAATDDAATQLSASDLRVTVDGYPAAITSLEPFTGTTAIGVLIDVSASMWMDNEAKSYRRALEAHADRLLQIGHGALTLAAFASAVHVQPVITDRPSFLAATSALFDVPDVEAHGPSIVWDALDGLLTTIDGRADEGVVVLITDGAASGNLRSSDEVMRRARALGIRVFVIAEGPEAHVLASAQARGQHPVTAAVNLQRLATVTGGTFLVDGLKDTWNRPRPEPFIDAILDVLARRSLVRFTWPAGVSPDAGVEITSGVPTETIAYAYRKR
jgi:hypothetical protein